MNEDIFLKILTIAGSGIFAYATIKVTIKNLVTRTEELENDNKSHFEDRNEIKLDIKDLEKQMGEKISNEVARKEFVTHTNLDLRFEIFDVKIENITQSQSRMEIMLKDAVELMGDKRKR